MKTYLLQVYDIIGELFFLIFYSSLICLFNFLHKKLLEKLKVRLIKLTNYGIKTLQLLDIKTPNSLTGKTWYINLTFRKEYYYFFL